ncbi:uncharacterized protein LOC122659048 [Telopea speciosissima]|uniref:uncharacterized protein LOC122659048 n=1 Tax=Telopea speciosissima TaxID=54955 RepID=UPI001CC5B5EF|nr:uncharacterized protein LOC122659048 [Telopea speciosissima]
MKLGKALTCSKCQGRSKRFDPGLQSGRSSMLSEVDLEVDKQMSVIRNIQAMPWHPHFTGLESEAQQDLQFLLNQQESLWKQKSRILWLNEGDRNTNIFHSSTLQRRSRNKINRLLSQRGEWLEKEGDIDREIFSFFNHLFSSDGSQSLERALQFIGPSFTDDRNTALCLPISDEEVKAAVFSMKSLKAPGPDGLPPVFFQAYWSTVGPKVCKAMRSFFNSGYLLKEEAILPSRGIRQGDPLSPSLFVLCTECLTSLIAGVADNGNLSGLRIKPTSPQLTHSFFANDCLIFLQANHSSLRSLRVALSLYCEASRQAVNGQKSSASFSLDTPQRLRHIFTKIINVEGLISPGIYLGLPSEIGRNKKAAFQILKDRTIAKIAGWKEQLLSQAGREVLIKAVVTASPSYHMSHFKIPQGLLDDISKASCSFYWGQKREERKIHWVGKDCIQLPKPDGGLGFKDLFIQNQALLAKLGWQLISNEESLWARLLKSIYYPSSSFFLVQTGSRPSWAWRSILLGKQLLDQGLIWIVRDGKWDVGKLQSFFLPFEVACILQIPISSKGSSDKLCWGPAPNGIFSVKSAYRLGSQQRSYFSKFVKKVNLTSKEVWNNVCGGCGAEAESTEHALFYCSVAKQAWFASTVALRVDAFPNLSLSEWILKWSSPSGALKKD